MKTEQTMLLRSAIGPLLRCAGRWAVAATVAFLAVGCAPKEQLVAPRVLMSPYDTTRGDVLWAVVPLRNESGTSLAESYDISDKVVAAAAQVRGLRVLPLNRTIAVMRAMKLTDLQTPADAKRLAAELGVDGLVLGSITAWDPYNPPKLGLALALYARPGAMEQSGGQALDTRVLQFQPTEYRYFPRSSFDSAPASVVSEYLDGKNHQVLMDVRSYAQGRHDPNTALGWRRYLASMDLYCEFAAWHTMSQLIDHEWLRLAKAPPRDTKK